MFTVSPQTSNANLRWPITPPMTGPEWTPIRRRSSATPSPSWRATSSIASPRSTSGDELVKSGEESVEQGDHVMRGQTRRQWAERDDVGKEHGYRGVLVGDRPFTGEEARRDRCRKDVEQQRVGPLLLEPQCVGLFENDDVLVEDAAA